MDWLLQQLDVELFRISSTPVTGLSIAVMVGVLLVGVFIGPLTRRALARVLIQGDNVGAEQVVGQARFGTFAGVFTPSILTILGVVMYLRVGWCVGHAGLGGILLIVMISHLITIATGLSVSSIATNRTVGAGGAYFIISRSLGAPVGAAIGIPLFFGQALSVTFYIVGFTESLQQLSSTPLPAKLISSGVLLVLTAVTLKSADLALKVQYVVMAAILASLVSFFAGHATFPDAKSAKAGIEWWSQSKPFAEVFAVFFPAVTGIMAGVGMSGDLKNPRESLPKGTMAAIFVGMTVYILFPLFMAIKAPPDALRADNNVVWKISWVPALIYAGVWGATLSSAIGSILTAPRTLQALATDGLAPRIFGKGYGPANEPRVGIVTTFILAETGILLGNLDAIAPVLTMFFLATYGLTNLACGLEKWAASPSFRPDFAVPSVVSLAGGLACFYVMSIINMLAMIAAMTFCALIYIVTQRRVLGTTYGDARHGIWAALVRSALHRLRRAEFHALNWRPNLIILGGDHDKRHYLLTLGSAIVQDRGIVTYFQLLPGDVEAIGGSRRERFRLLDDRVHEQFPNVFCRVDVVTDKYGGAVTIAQSYGVGSFEANTVMLGWPRKDGEESHRMAYVEMLRDLAALDKSLLIVRYDQERKFGTYQEIHIWWGGLQNNGGLMLLLGYLLTANHQWRNAKVSVMTVVDTERMRDEVEGNIRRIIQNARVTAEPRVLLRSGRSIGEIMKAESSSADLAIAGLRLPDRDKHSVSMFFERMNGMLANMPTTVLVHSARDFESEPVLFDQPESKRATAKEDADEAKAKPPAARATGPLPAAARAAGPAASATLANDDALAPRRRRATETPLLATPPPEESHPALSAADAADAVAEADAESAAGRDEADGKKPDKP
ncbi:MAG: amino acid permease [Myxococcales bacterium]|nr:amino acid permease [Myxococcales bacterium]